VGIFYKPTEINPITTDSSISANILDLVFNTLVRFSGEKDVRPEIAERWEISADGLTWTFHLRNDVYFHDGTLLTADDVKFIFDKIIKRKNGGYVNSLKYVQAIRILDSNTIQFQLKKSDQLLWDALGVVSIGPRHLLEGRSDFREYNAHPIGSGPYTFVRQTESEIVLQANEHYFSGRPYLDSIEFKILQNQPACLNHLISGDVDMVFLLNPEDHGALSQIPYLTIYDNWYPLLYMLTLNLKDELFRSPSVRKAISLSVERPLIIQRILKGKGKIPEGTIMPERMTEATKGLVDNYQPALALKLLQADGWQIDPSDYILRKAGRKFEFTALTLEGHDSNTRTLQMMQEQLRQIGIQMDIKTLHFEEYVDLIFRQRKFQANLVYQIYRPFSDNDNSFWHSSQVEEGLNYSFYRNAVVDGYLDKMRFLWEPHQREDAYLGFQTAMHDDPPAIFLFWRRMPIAIRKRFRGVPETRMESLRDLVNVWVPKEEQ